MPTSPNTWSLLRGACLSALATAAVLAPLTAQALDFRFFFNPSGMNRIRLSPDGSIATNPDGTFVVEYEIEGLITGLSDNKANQQPLTVEIVKTLNDSLALGSYSPLEGSGFSVSAGQVETADWGGLLMSQEHYRRLAFWDSSFYGGMRATLKDNPPAPLQSPMPWPTEPTWIEGVGYTWPICACVTTTGPDPTPGSMALFVPVTDSAPDLTPPFIRQTPGPLPILGAAATYGFAGRLRRRIRQTSTTV